MQKSIQVLCFCVSKKTLDENVKADKKQINYSSSGEMILPAIALAAAT